MKQHISLAVCVTVMSGVLLSRRAAIQNELAVGIALYATTKSANDMLRTVYSKANYDCASVEGKDYKTVMRRMQCSRLLFKRIGAAEVLKWMEDKSDRAKIAAIAEHLKVLELNSVDDAMAYCGRVRERTEKEPVGEALLIKTEHLNWRVPKNVDPKELYEAASQLNELAHRLEQEMAEVGLAA